MRTLRNAIANFWRYAMDHRFDRSLIKYFDWPLFFIVIAISLFGVVCIFSATTTSVTERPATVMEMLATQPINSARLQLIWVGASVVGMALLIYFSYEVYGRAADVLYVINLLMLLVVLGMEAGRGGMKGWFTWGSNQERTFQPSEVGKIAIIIALAKAFARRARPIMRFRDMLSLLLYIAIPLVLIIAQPDVGTGLVYLAIFAMLVLASGTNWKLIAAVVLVLALLIVPVWYFANSTMDNFRLTRILIWLNPEAYPEEGAQVINAKIAASSGGLFGKGIVSPGSFASLGYISDDHTDFIFAITCESFGMVGAVSLLIAYAFLIGRLVYLSLRVKDALGSYMIIGVMGMLLAHIIENLCMVIGLLPVTGIPLPFMSYGGSNLVTNMLGIGLVMNIVMRDRASEESRAQGSVVQRALQI